MIEIVIVALVGLCWGSFLNVVASRLIRNKEWIKTRSSCPHCHHKLAWYDLFPLISWMILRGKCRHCHKLISWFYPFMELITALIFVGLWVMVPWFYLPAYVFLSSLLLISTRTDLESFLIFRSVTWGMIPFGFLASLLKLVPTAPWESMVGIILGYGIMWVVRALYFRLKKQEGLGLGDADILALIGSFLGIKGAWVSLSLAGISGTFVMLIVYIGLLIRKKTPSLELLRRLKIPFVPFLSLGAILYMLFFETCIFYLGL